MARSTLCGGRAFGRVVVQGEAGRRGGRGQHLDVLVEHQAARGTAGSQRRNARDDDVRADRADVATPVAG